MATNAPSNGANTKNEEERTTENIVTKNNRTPINYDSRNNQTERRNRIGREEERALSRTRTTDGAAENVRSRMRGIRPEGRIDPAPADPITEARSRRPGEGMESPRTGSRTKSSGMTNTPPNPAEGRRNETRRVEADRKDAKLIGESNEEKGRGRMRGATVTRTTGNTTIGGTIEHLDRRAEMFFLPPLLGPDDKFKTPDWFIREVVRISRTETKTPTKPPIQFDLTDEAMENNAKELEKVGYDLSRLIEENSETTLHYGSEFRTVAEIEPLLGRHPNFNELVSVLSKGMSYVFTRELDPATKWEEMQTLILRGNHKSAQENPAQVGILLGKDVNHGFVIPIPVNTIHLIPGAAVQPLGLVQQWTTQEDGTRTPKYRITQDLSFSSNRSGPTRSINSRIDMGAYSEMIYGWCFPRILHYIVSMRIHHPSDRILISKYDYSDAYRRIAHSSSAAAQTIAVNDGKAFLSLRLTFGGSPNPPTWCMFSEIVTDLANELSGCIDWDHRTTRSPAQATTPKPIRLPNGIPLEKGRTMSVLVPETKGGKVDGFIDDLINVFLDSEENCARQPHVVPLAMHITSRPHAGEGKEPIPRRPILSQPKLVAEGSPAEVQVVLGWKVDTRRLEVSLPRDKFDAWMLDLRVSRESKRVDRKELERLLGRLNHAAYVMPIARHFLGRIRTAVGPAPNQRTKGGRTTKLSEAVKADLRLWESLLRQARKGISMNLLVTRQPDRICWSDACPQGIGGYNLNGRAWRVRIPKSSPIHGDGSVNNLLEFVGMVVNVWLSCLEPGSDQACILAIGDNTSAIGWLNHTANIASNAGGTHLAQLNVARKLARTLLKYNCCLASQHVKGELNIVADLLSFEGNDRGKHHPLAYDQPPNDVLTERFIKHLPTQQESSNEGLDRLWRRWEGYCDYVGYNRDVYLDRLSVDERGVFTKAFLSFYRTTNWSTTGKPTGDRKEPMVSNTLRQAASNLATAFRISGRPSPMHVQGSTHMLHTIRKFLKAGDNTDPPKSQQRAVTPKLLRAMFARAWGDGVATGVGIGTGRPGGGTERSIADIAITAYFFAMRSCEITNTPRLGRTKILRLKGVTFRNDKGDDLGRSNCNVIELATRVTVTFEDQKNGLKMDRRTHQRTGDPVMCPVRSLTSLVRRILETVTGFNDDTQINTVEEQGRVNHITGEQLRRSMRETCKERGGKEAFGYNADEIGTRSLRSGAAMGLFLMNHSVAKIMMLGRWSSDAFLVYIRPQVMEWTNQMSGDMIVHDSFFDAGEKHNSKTGGRQGSGSERTRGGASTIRLRNDEERTDTMHLHH